MLPRKNRVKRKIFPKSFASGRIFHSQNFILRATPFGEETKISFIVSKTVASLAVKRNFLRRRGYAIARNLKNKIKNNPTLIFLFKKNSGKISAEEMREEITNLLMKANLFGK